MDVYVYDYGESGHRSGFPADGLQGAYGWLWIWAAVVEIGAFSLSLSFWIHSRTNVAMLIRSVYLQYARYFGGDLRLISMEGYGTDVYIHLNRLSSSREPLQ